MIGEPPVKPGATKPTEIAADCADTDTMVAAFGSTPTMSNERLTGLAADQTLLPGWFAVIVQRPTARTDTDRPVREHTAGVSLVNVTDRPDDADTTSVPAGSPNSLLEGGANEIVWFNDPTVIVCWASTATAE
jgi:hypothetical protein